MARINKKKQKAQQAEEKRKLRKWVYENGGGTKLHFLRCEGCKCRLLGGEHAAPTICPLCGNETALYDPQLL